MIFLRLAARNVMRNVRRSVITVAAVSLGMTALLFNWAFIDGVNEQMIDNSTRYLAGHLQVHRKGYHDDQSLDRLLADGPAVAAEVSRLLPGSPVSTRLEGSALASVGEKSRGVMVLGLDPDSERAVTTLAETVREGSFLAAAEPAGIVLGARIAEALQSRVGGEIVLVTQAADGSVGAARYRVRGIFRTRMDMLDGSYVLMNLGAARDLYAAADGITTVVARLADRAAVPTARARVESALGPDHEVLDWPQLLPSVVQSVSFHTVVGYVLLLVLFIVVAVGITNTVLMAVMERTREFGVMMALGTRQGQLTRVVFYEACLLGLAGVVLGTALGMSIVLFFAARGMDFGAYVQAMETMQGLTSMIYPLPRWDRLALIAGLVFGVGILAALYPAWRATRLVPVAAIKGLPDEGGLRRRIAGRLPRLPLPLLAKMAARGIGRNPHRTALTLAASAFGVGAFVFLGGFVDGYLAQLVENSTGYVTGHLQVQHPRLRTEMEPANSMTGTEAVLQGIRALPQVRAAAPRVQNMVLASSAAQSQNMMLVGIDPVAERGVTFMHRAVRSGRALAPGADRDIVLGDRLAGKLGLRLGDRMVVMTQALNGEVGSAAFRVAGIFDTGSDAFDAGMGFVTLKAGQDLLGMQDRLSAIAVRLDDRALEPDALAGIQRLLAPGAAVAVGWRNLMPEVDQMIQYVGVVVRLLAGIVLAVVAIGIMNTLLMSVMERTRELGIMMALGTRPRTIVALVLLESLVLAVAGIAAGIALGAPLVAYFGVRGIDMSAYVKGIESIPGLTSVIHPMFVPAGVALPVLVLLVLSATAALYPAWRAARLEPATAIRHA